MISGSSYTSSSEASEEQEIKDVSNIYRLLAHLDFRQSLIEIQ